MAGRSPAYELVVCWFVEGLSFWGCAGWCLAAQQGAGGGWGWGVWGGGFLGVEGRGGEKRGEEEGRRGETHDGIRVSDFGGDRFVIPPMTKRCHEWGTQNLRGSCADGGNGRRRFRMGGWFGWHSGVWHNEEGGWCV